MRLGRRGPAGATRALWKEATGIEMIDGIGATELMHIFISADEKDALPGATGKVVPGTSPASWTMTASRRRRARSASWRSRARPAAATSPTSARPATCRNGWNYTGDAYALDADGYFHYHSRTDDMIISAGYNIAGPRSRMPAAPSQGGRMRRDRRARRGARPGRQGHRRAAPGTEPTPETAKELQDFVKQSIAPYKYPRQVEFVASLPRTETGKLQRFRLRHMPMASRRAGRWCSLPARSAGTKSASFPAMTSSPRPSRR
jgi:2-aminobenzoate-CoA ligase